mgnify:CR=1 FL=1
MNFPLRAWLNQSELNDQTTTTNLISYSLNLNFLRFFFSSLLKRDHSLMKSTNTRHTFVYDSTSCG